MSIIPPSFPELYDFETQIEEVFAGILKDNAIQKIPNTYSSRDAVKIQTPGVILRFVTGNPASQRTMQGTPARQVPNAFEGVMFVEIVTGRRLNDAVHGIFRGAVRYLLSASANLISNDNMPYLQITEFLPAGGTPLMTDEKELDRSSLHFAMKFAIRDEAWPAS